MKPIFLKNWHFGNRDSFNSTRFPPNYLNDSRCAVNRS